MCQPLSEKRQVSYCVTFWKNLQGCCAESLDGLRELVVLLPKSVPLSVSNPFLLTDEALSPFGTELLELIWTLANELCR
jgi:hypothetical protein